MAATQQHAQREQAREHLAILRSRMQFRNDRAGAARWQELKKKINESIEQVFAEGAHRNNTLDAAPSVSLDKTIVIRCDLTVGEVHQTVFVCVEHGAQLEQAAVEWAKICHGRNYERERLLPESELSPFHLEGTHFLRTDTALQVGFKNGSFIKLLLV
ncbi:uncharacterized protein K452DRAFT_302575 [Aplosporella prunicola CBS 121167]|uniref:Uncharacterized protein n=1 Tax=Aplosporella prunicola CBS 121167 TaxID=1176127 RepID=A0A6A6AXG5_9PEZI|nr:uncharacterized protein K452DRAFT_302575 [Aplosporella prunicola CBS 121167]KAF2136629.1 hypothetical protein K452DRAFT_302575 [Aplosporella prunicola CBS 121167]